MLEITSTDPLIYATPRDDLLIADIQLTAGQTVLLFSNLTAQCEYSIQLSPDLTGAWSNAASFTASSPLATWSNALQRNKEFYRAVGSPQQNP